MKNPNPITRCALLLLALAAVTLVTGCTAYTAASEDNPGSRDATGGSSHGSVPHSH